MLRLRMSLGHHQGATERGCTRLGAEVLDLRSSIGCKASQVNQIHGELNGLHMWFLAHCHSGLHVS